MLKMRQSAFRDLESTICDLRGAALLMQMAADDTVFRREPETQKQVLGKLEGYIAHLFTEEQSEGLQYALWHVIRLAEQVHRDAAGSPDDAWNLIAPARFALLHVQHAS